ncbi:MAG: 3-oxoacyl-[acyl-carrier-protein] synthase III C-terminal domain-containing protein [Candidatus Zixiibacteriota bacterium]
MPKLTAIATAVPAYRVSQDQARTFAARLFGEHLSDIDRLMPLFDNAGIQSRYFSVPVEWFATDHSLDEKNQLYIESATRLGAEAAQQVLNRTGTDSAQIDYIIYVNTTGLATPSIDARLINVLGLRRDIRRTPIWGLGCAGGAAGLAHAYHYLLGHPDHRVLLVAVELCGLTFIRDDYSKSNLVACALFGEGAAATLVCGDELHSEGLTILDTKSSFYPDSLSVMGWNIVARGMQVVFDRRIPDIVAQHAAAELDSFLAKHNLDRASINYFLYHPGGVKVVQAYESAYGVNGDLFALSRAILRDYGNMSSVSVLFVISRFLQENTPQRSGYGLVSALGPGFCSESLLVQC